MRQSKRRREAEFINGGYPRPPLGMNLGLVHPKTFNQARVFKEYANGRHLTLHGVPGSGKSFLSLYLALDSVTAGEYDKVIIVRSAVPSRDQGFLPGSIKDKQAVYEAPYENICTKLYGRSDAYGILKQRKLIEFTSTSYVRGIEYDNCVVILDEIQNASYHESNSVITRVGDNCRLILAGDYYQSDLKDDNERQGLWTILSRLKKMDNTAFIEFKPEDIVRSAFVKKWIELEWAERTGKS